MNDPGGSHVALSDDVLLAVARRDSVVEAAHRGHIAVVHPDGRCSGVGRPDLVGYPRSALKPAQAAAVVAAVDEQHDRGWAGLVADPVASLAVACGSHTGGLSPTVEAAYLLAVAGLDESALGCPSAWPRDDVALAAARGRDRLAHGCSGLHAATLLAHTTSGGAVESYTDPGSPLQRRTARSISAWAGEDVGGPGVDGCGLPAWTLSLAALARLYARLAVDLPLVAQAMRARPDLVGGAGVDDTRLMLAIPGIVAKRGAEGLLAAATPGGLGVVVKISDGSSRAALPVMASVLSSMGVAVPVDLTTRVVLGGGRPRGALDVSAEAVAAAA